jgi:hypothetical protein
MPIRFEALLTETVRALQRGGPDAYGHAPERRVSDGDGVPCRHCLKDVAAGDAYLVVAHRPFDTLQPYAETGPIFLHAHECERAPASDAHPSILASPDYIVRGYDAGERIVYGTGAVIPTERISEYADRLLGQERVAFVHIRSARNNCFQCRIERA